MNDPMWDFALAVYSAPGVAQECVALQDDHGVDVNILLFCSFAGAIDCRELSDKDMAEIEALAAGWRQAVVEPLRQCRRTLKSLAGAFGPDDRGAAEALRQRVKDVELDAERLALARLMAWWSTRQATAVSGGAGAADANIRRLLMRSSIDGRTPPFPVGLAAAARAQASKYQDGASP